MGTIIGIIITICMVFGGYTIAGGHMDIIFKSLPYEMMMIGGAAIGAFVVGNDMGVIKHTGSDLMKLFTGPKWKKQDYKDLLCLMFDLIRIAKESPVEIEQHIEGPAESEIFNRFPKIAKDKGGG